MDVLAIVILALVVLFIFGGIFLAKWILILALIVFIVWLVVLFTSRNRV